MSRTMEAVRRLAENLRRGSAQVDSLRAKLYDGIRRAHHQGHSLGEIAKVAGLSKARIQQIVEEGRGTR